MIGRGVRRRLLAPTLAVACAAGCSGDPDPRTEGTRRMADRLAALSIDAPETIRDRPGRNSWAINQPGVIPLLRDRLTETADPRRRLEIRFEIAEQLLLDGRSEDALREFETLESELLTGDIPFSPEVAAELQGLIGLSALRLGEQENCIASHTARSCIFPVEADGIHSLSRGSRRAVEAFANQLALAPEDLTARWLLNLAHMTLGGYPDRVPGPWRIPPDRFGSERDPGPFVDRGAAAGVAVVGVAGGAVMEDLDGDGLLDLVASSWALGDALRYFHNDGNGAFTDLTVEAGLEGETGGLNLSHADYDNDGDADLLVLRGAWLGEAGLHPNSLLRNDGDGTFADVTEEAGLLSFHPSHAGIWGDYDNDGDLDLFIGNEQRSTRKPHPSQLFRNDGDGTFTDVAAAAGVADSGFVKGAAWGDYDNDGDLDLYVSRFGQSNLLLRNDDSAGGRRFRDVTGDAGVGEPVFSFPTWFWDYDNDGWLDLYVGAWDGAMISEVAAEYLGAAFDAEVGRLYHNSGDGTFRDVTGAARLDRGLLTMAANFGDIDNDGWPDLYLANGAPDLRSLMPNRMFRNDAGTTFQDVTRTARVGHLQKGHGVAFGDLDNDGDQDIYAVMGGWFSGDVYPNVLFENPGHGHAWITLVLEGTRSNRSGVGARIRVRVRTGSGTREIHVTASTGGSFGSSSLQTEIGLGDASAIESVEIRWPSGEVSRLAGLALNAFYAVREGEARALPLERPILRLAEGPPDDHRHEAHQK